MDAPSLQAEGDEDDRGLDNIAVAATASFAEAAEGISENAPATTGWSAVKGCGKIGADLYSQTARTVPASGPSGQSLLKGRGTVGRGLYSDTEFPYVGPEYTLLKDPDGPYLNIDRSKSSSATRCAHRPAKRSPTRLVHRPAAATSSPGKEPNPRLSPSPTRLVHALAAASSSQSEEPDQIHSPIVLVHQPASANSSQLVDPDQGPSRPLPSRSCAAGRPGMDLSGFVKYPQRFRKARYRKPFVAREVITFAHFELESPKKVVAVVHAGPWTSPKSGTDHFPDYPREHPRYVDKPRIGDPDRATPSTPSTIPRPASTNESDNLSNTVSPLRARSQTHPRSPPQEPSSTSPVALGA
ncbi:hypothetical protein BDK51DRAFT_38546 [Blyttiomyces helicus]|uniref:Uncharacterized protein n=1 Tax=Blyttiomyces helicus TaxID=388810 RepID=A0A4P9W7E9_9FUNG|nr:hypothetical protein BDK51DRAFT_38546 [Blyttiomyces helicus]|eukprot:RKO87305.1 hypothetical protein BDK51DRAFT_38546 [Blyttiomyces helicus]